MHQDDLPIREPCDADWGSMLPHEQGRFCSICSTVVHDLSSMTYSEALVWLKEHDGQGLCVRYARDPSGTLVFAQANPPNQSKQGPLVLTSPDRLVRAKRVLVKAAAAIIPLATSGCEPQTVNGYVCVKVPPETHILQNPPNEPVDDSTTVPKSSASSSPPPKR